MKHLPVVLIEIDGKPRPYYWDGRLNEYRSIDGSAPWIIATDDVEADEKTDVLRHRPA